MSPRRSSQSASPGTSLPSGSVGPLPFALNSLIGRETDSLAASERLMSPMIRLLTMVGPGGIGKSRLALDVAHRLAPRFTDGAQLIRLAPVTDPDLVPILLFRALGIRSQIADERDWWAIRDRNALLLIDNFEQVLDAAPTLVDVLTNCPYISMLVTSRVPLNISGEHEFRVPPLATLAGDHETSESMLQSTAVQLFIERSAAVRSGYSPTPDDLNAIARLTHQLDGLPLAIELAAAQSRHLSPAAIEQRLESSIDALSGGPVDRPLHQQALRDTIAWSYDLLEPDLQRAYRLLAIFSGNVMPQAASFVLGFTDEPKPILADGEHDAIDSETLTIFAELSENSLLVRGTDFGLQPRFSMLMTIRTFGQRQLRENGEWDRARARHAEWFYSLANRASQTSTSISDPDWFDWLEIEHENLRLALDWYQSRHDLIHFAAFANSLVQFWLIRSHVGEGARWLQLVLDEDDGSSIDPLTRARLLDAAGWMALRQGRIDDFRTFAEQSLLAARVSGEARQIASSLRLLGEVEDRSTRYEVAAIYVGEAFRIYRQAGNLTGVADTLASLGGLALDSGDLDQAVRLFERGIEAATAVEDIHLCARVTNALSVTRFTRGEFALALTCAEQSLAWYIRVGDARGMAMALDHIGRYSRALGDFKRAWENHQTSLEKRRQFGEMRGLVVWLELVNELLLSCGAYEAAACVLGGTEGMRQRGALPLHNHELPERKSVFETIRRHVAPDIVRQCGERGAAMSLQELIDFAWSKADAAVNDDPEIVVETVDRFTRFGMTAREREIAELLVNRRSDREIADQLFISPRTANAHITRVLKKLDVHSRRDVARMLGEVPAE